MRERQIGYGVISNSVWRQTGNAFLFVCVSLLGWLVAVLTRSADTLVGHQTVYIKKGYQTKTLIQYSVLVCTHCALCNVASFSHLS